MNVITQFIAYMTIMLGIYIGTLLKDGNIWIILLVFIPTAVLLTHIIENYDEKKR